MINYKKAVSKLAEDAGVTINGDNPWEIQVHDDSLYKQVALHGTLGLGEGHMDGLWDCEHIDQLFNKVLRSRVERRAHFNLSTAAMVIGHIFTNIQSIARSKKVGEVHYDLSNEFYSKMLDKRMIYSCGYWKHSDNLDAAQEAKLDMICQKLELTAGETLLDIGCGWGGMAKFAAERYGVRVTGVTISKEQAVLARETCKGLDVEILLQDYRHLQGQFDKIVSVGMFEHVGTRNYRTYMQVVNEKLKDEGLFLLHTIGHRYRTYTNDPWSNKYIFPNGKIPYVGHIGKAINGTLILEDWHNFGMDYATTLRAWYDNFEQHWPTFSEQYGERFYRMWKYYLLCFAGAFDARHMQLWQIVLSKPARSTMYHSIRN